MSKNNKVNNKHGFIYIWRDKLHKRFYVGCHWGKEDDGYICSSNWMRDAYRLRPHDFKRRIIKTGITSREALYTEELRYLQMIKPSEVKVRYYNLHITNNEIWHKYDETIKTVGQKISVSKTGKPTNIDYTLTGAKISATKQATNQALRNAGLPVRTKEHGENLGKALKGRVQTEEEKDRRSKSMKEYYEVNPSKHLGTKHTEEHKLAISATLKANNRKLTLEEKEVLQKANSKTYQITYKDGRIETIQGLKQFGVANSIPYVTLRKSLENQTPIHKYSIASIMEYKKPSDHFSVGGFFVFGVALRFVDIQFTPSETIATSLTG